MRIAIMRSGGTGGYFGALLARAGEDVAFIARGAHLDSIRDNGLTVKTSYGGDFTIEAKATDNPAEIGLVDLVLFCVKAYDTAAAAEVIRPMIGPETAVLSVQNGIDNQERIANIVGPGHVIGATARVSSVIERPGVIAHQAVPGGMITLGELDGRMSRRAEDLLATFKNAGIDAEISSGIQATLWQKFIGICGVSGLSTLTQLPMGPIMACPETRELFRRTMEEVEAVARAKGIGLLDGVVDRAIDLMSKLPPSFRGSMYYDLVAGRRLELESLNGAAIRLGDEMGIPTPMNFAIYAALKPYVNGAPEMP